MKLGSSLMLLAITNGSDCVYANIKYPDIGGSESTEILPFIGTALMVHFKTSASAAINFQEFQDKGKFSVYIDIALFCLAHALNITNHNRSQNVKQNNTEPYS